MSAADVLAGRAQWAIEQGDVLDCLAALPDESVNCVVTSPPYWGLRDYGTGEWVGGCPDCDHRPNNTHQRQGQAGQRANRAFTGFDPFKGACGKCGATRVDQQIGLEPTPDAYVARMVAVFAEVRRVLRSDGTCWVNLGDSYAANRTYQVPSTKGGPKHSPAQGFEGSAMSVPDGLKPKDLIGIPWRVAFALQADGWWLRSDVIWAKPNPMPESVTDRPTRSHEYLFLLTKAARYWYDAAAIAEPVTGGAHRRTAYKMPDGWDTGPGGHGSFHRNGREKGRPGVTPKSAAPGQGIKANESFHAAVNDLVTVRNKRTVWEIPSEPYPDAHFATMPTALVEPCILAGCPVGGVVLDPFVGSGTVVLEALRHGRRGIGVDLSPAYVAMARRRVEGDCPMFNTEAAG